MNKWKATAGILLIFVLGILSGAMGTSLMVKGRIMRFLDPEGPPPPIRFIQRRLDHLDLSPEQRAGIDPLVESMQKEFRGLWQQAQPQIKAMFDKHMEQIKAELNADQRRDLDRALKKMKRRMNRRPGPPPEHDRERFPRPLGKRFEKDLDLSPEALEQYQAVMREMKRREDEILRRQMDARRSFQEKINDEMRRVYADAESTLAGILSPRQMQLLTSEGFFEPRQPHSKRPMRPFHRTGP